MAQWGVMNKPCCAIFMSDYRSRFRSPCLVDSIGNSLYGRCISGKVTCRLQDGTAWKKIWQ